MLHTINHRLSNNMAQKRGLKSREWYQTEPGVGGGGGGGGGGVSYFAQND